MINGNDNVSRIIMSDKIQVFLLLETSRGTLHVVS